MPPSAPAIWAGALPAPQHSLADSLGRMGSDRGNGLLATHGSAELRVPVGTVNFIVRSRLGVFGLAEHGMSF